MISVYPWQQPSVDRAKQILAERNFLLNTAGTGTGKSVVTTQVCKDLGLQALVICPKAVNTAWRRTAEDMEYRGFVDATNYERLQYKNPYYIGNKWHLDGISAVITDELHKGASGEKSKTARIIAELKAYPVKVMALSATIADNPLKLRCVGFLSDQHAFNTASYRRWCLSHACFRRPGTNSLMFNKGAAGTRAMEDIARALAPYRIHIDSDTVENFPSSLVVPKLFDLEEHNKAEFDRIMAEMPDKLKSTTVTNSLTLLLRARMRTELLKVPVLLDLVQDAIEEGLAPVCFVSFRDTVFALQDGLRALGISYSTIIGDQKPEERDRNIDEFQRDKTQAMLATTSSGGVGISLHALRTSTLRNRTSFITPNFSASEFIQALGRCHRAGGHNVVQTIVLAADTVETKIYDAIQGKLARLALLNDADLI